MMQLITCYTFFQGLLLSLTLFSCHADSPVPQVASEMEQEVAPIIVGAAQLQMYYPLIDGKNVGLVVNQTSTIGDVHLVDSLIAMDVKVKAIFSPEHGFRGNADAGEKVKNGVDVKTGLPIVSLYGKNKKPSQEQLKGIDVLLFDIQDVGVRFYTYISTLHYIMEAAAEKGIPVIVLDRPNPNAHYIDGPILEPEFKSFVGMHPVPIVYGMTIGEYAQMINGEKWLKSGIQCDLTVVQLKNYNHDMLYELPIKPSPNLPNIRSILLYPSLCLFEGSTVSIGRGTDTQFQVIGHPDNAIGSYAFTPVSMDGAKHPKHEGKTCYGTNLSTMDVAELHDVEELNLSYLLAYYKDLTSQKVTFFNDNNFFEKLAGTSSLRKQIIAGNTESEIRDSWADGLQSFMDKRSLYLLYD